MSTILVTGSAGFIGFHTAKALLDRGELVVGVDNLNEYYDSDLKRARNNILLSNPNYTFYHDSLANDQLYSEKLSQYSFTAVCHLAAQAGVRYSLSHPLEYEENNLKAFLLLLEFMRKQKLKKLVFASSSSVYGSNEMPKDGFNEQQALSSPISLYGATKIANEVMAHSYHRLYGISCVGLRFFTAYGEWGRPDMAYYSFTKAILNREPIKIFNHGNMSRDMTYISDIVDGILASLDSKLKFEIMNLAYSHAIQLGKIVESLEKTIGIEAIKKYESIKPGDLKDTYGNISKAQKLLHFKPQVSLEDGLQRFVRWYKEYHQL